jgi:hypothetical protein
MAVMNYYHLLKYEKDPGLRQVFAKSLADYWKLERPELNPFFNFIAAARLEGESFTDAYGKEELSPTGEWLSESVDTLRRFPLNLVEWRLENSHRNDIMPLSETVRPGNGGQFGVRVNGKVLPVDERMVVHWNHDPYRLDQGRNGSRLADGASFLLPYYMGLFHGFLAEE